MDGSTDKETEHPYDAGTSAETPQPTPQSPTKDLHTCLRESAAAVAAVASTLPSVMRMKFFSELVMCIVQNMVATRKLTPEDTANITQVSDSLAAVVHSCPEASGAS
jgi:hypothetical protein